MIETVDTVDVHDELFKIARSIEYLSKMLSPIAMPGSKARLSKDEAMAALSWTANAGVAVRRLIAVAGPLPVPKNDSRT